MTYIINQIYEDSNRILFQINIKKKLLHSTQLILNINKNDNTHNFTVHKTQLVDMNLLNLSFSYISSYNKFNNLDENDYLLYNIDIDKLKNVKLSLLYRLYNGDKYKRILYPYLCF